MMRRWRPPARPPRPLPGTRHASSLAQSDTSPAEYLARIAARNPALNAFVAVDDTLPAELPRMTVAVKDNICTSALPTTCASRALSNFRPPYTSTPVRLLQAAGAHIVGKTNLDEFGMGSYNVHSAHGPVRNPSAPDRVSGGSSGGSAVAVAAGMCDLALGTDTGGSIRLPASYCGVFGFKPSYGLISRHGVVAYADSLDCVGLLARDVDTLQQAFAVTAQPDARDPTSAPLSLRRAARASSAPLLSLLTSARSSLSTRSPHPAPPGPLTGLRIGVPLQSFPSALSPASLPPLRTALRRLRALGAQLVSVSLPSTPYALSAYYVIASAEAASNLARYDGVRYGWREEARAEGPGEVRDVYARTRSRAFGEEVKKRILLGTYALTADAFDNYFLQAQRVRRLVRADFDAVFRAPNVLNYAPGDPFFDSLSSPGATVDTDHTDTGEALTRYGTRDGVDVLLHPTTIGPPPLLSSVLARTPASSSTSDPSLSAYVQDVLSVPASLAGLPALNVPIPIPDAQLQPDEGQAESGSESQSVGHVGVSVVGQWGADEVVLAVGAVIADAR